MVKRIELGGCVADVDAARTRMFCIAWPSRGDGCQDFKDRYLQPAMPVPGIHAF